ncbi:MAG: phosphotransferase [Solirubrobacteraceae bacterium]
MPEHTQPLLDPADRDGLERYLADRGWLVGGERIGSIARAGEGNMNLTLRVRTTVRSVIVKQGRPWVEKYPVIAAPARRTAIEADWYELAGSVPGVAARLPRLLGVDRQARVLLLSDLGDTGDYLHLYAGAKLSAAETDALVDWLLELHGAFLGDERARRLCNREMRVLNHEHIFAVPLRAGNGLDLDQITPGLSALAGELREDRELLATVGALGERYLTADRGTLLHGDYYPGSWLQAPEPWVIDPEFGFYGPPEFDLGVMLAHLQLADQPVEHAGRAIARYRRSARLDPRLAWRFAAVEVIRRLLGVAQLPVSFDLAAKRTLIDRAREQLTGVDR